MWHAFIAWLGDKLIDHALRRTPDFIIGGAENPYLIRWWLIPRNRFFNIYLHRLVRDDDDRALHDHPWINLSILLRGGYWDVTKKGRFLRLAGDVVFRRAVALHRLELFDERVATWSLFVTGPIIREWGFACPQGWVHWKVFTNPADDGATIGRGCD